MVMKDRNDDWDFIWTKLDIGCIILDKRQRGNEQKGILEEMKKREEKEWHG